MKKPFKPKSVGAGALDDWSQILYLRMLKVLKSHWEFQKFMYCNEWVKSLENKILRVLSFLTRPVLLFSFCWNMISSFSAHRQNPWVKGDFHRLDAIFFLQVLEGTVSTRIESTQAVTRETDKMWLVRLLEITRKYVLDDLIVVKNLMVQCFPPHYNTFNR